MLRSRKRKNKNESKGETYPALRGGRGGERKDATKKDTPSYWGKREKRMSQGEAYDVGPCGKKKGKRGLKAFLQDHDRGGKEIGSQPALVIGQIRKRPVIPPSLPRR